MAVEESEFTALGLKSDFPVGLRVLVVDDNDTCLSVARRLLESCKYNVTVTHEAITGLEMLRENRENYDLVITDVHMPHMNGFTLLDHIIDELDIPVVMLSANDDPKSVRKGVDNGAADYLVKPVRTNELRTIWQHVVRKLLKEKLMENAVCNENAVQTPVNANPKETQRKKRKERVRVQSAVAETAKEQPGETSDNLVDLSEKKDRIVWTPELHKQFIDAVNTLGPQKAFPKKILTLMNVEGVTRENVASHLQKYRLYLKKRNHEEESSTTNNGMLFGIQDEAVYINGTRSLLGSFDAVHSNTHDGQRTPATGIARIPGPFSRAEAYRSNISQPSSNLGRSLLQDQSFGSSRLMNMSPLQNQISVMPAANVTSMQNWQTPTGHQNILVNNNQISPANLSNSFSCPDFSQLRVESPFTNPSGTVGGPNAMVNGGGQGLVQNVGYNMAQQQIWEQNRNGYTTNISGGYNNYPMVPTIGSSNPSFGVVPAEFNNNVKPVNGQAIHNTSGLMQNMMGNDVDELIGLEDNFFLEEANVLSGFNQSDCGSLDDIVGGYPN